MKHHYRLYLKDSVWQNKTLMWFINNEIYDCGIHICCRHK